MTYTVMQWSSLHYKTEEMMDDGYFDVEDYVEALARNGQDADPISLEENDE